MNSCKKRGLLTILGDDVRKLLFFIDNALTSPPVPGLLNLFEIIDKLLFPETGSMTGAGNVAISNVFQPKHKC